jgi:hypothetical protein
MKKLESEKASPVIFNPTAEYSFWFWKHKLPMVFELLALLIDYDFADGEIEGNILGIEGTNNEIESAWFSAGLHYGNKNCLYIRLSQDAENVDIVHIFIAFDKKIKEQIEFIDLLQSKFKWFEKN